MKERQVNLQLGLKFRLLLTPLLNLTTIHFKFFRSFRFIMLLRVLDGSQLEAQFVVFLFGGVG